MDREGPPRDELHGLTWRTIESAPYDRTNVLLSDGDWVSEGYWCHDDGHEGWYAAGGDWTDTHDTELRNVTHWMPLPEPPK